MNFLELCSANTCNRLFLLNPDVSPSDSRQSFSIFCVIVFFSIPILFYFFINLKSVNPFLYLLHFSITPIFFKFYPNLFFAYLRLSLYILSLSTFYSLRIFFKTLSFHSQLKVKSLFFSISFSYFTFLLKPSSTWQWFSIWFFILVFFF